MNEVIKNETKKDKYRVLWTVFGIFSAAVILICGLIFLFEYRNAYSDDGIIPPSLGVIILYFLFAFTAVIAAIVLKIVFRKQVSILLLFGAAIFLPIICYQFNYHMLKEDALLYPLVDKSEPFHFITIGDFNFDGMNDKEYNRLYKERKYSSGYGGSTDDTELDHITVDAIGTGGALVGTFADYDEDKNAIHLHLNKTGVTYKEIKLTIAFKNPEDAKKVVFYLGGQLNHAINEDDTVYMIFDESTCAGWQRVNENEYIEVIIKYAL